MADLAKQLKLPKQRIHLQDAGFLRRMLAFFVDLLLLDFIVFSAFETLLLSSKPDMVKVLNGTASLSPEVYTSAVLMMLLALCYFWLFEWLLAQTPGMMLLSIETQNVTLWNGLVRNLYLIPLFPFPLLWIMEPLYLLLKKRRFLEVITKTRTIQRISY